MDLIQHYSQILSKGVGNLLSNAGKAAQPIVNGAVHTFQQAQQAPPQFNAMLPNTWLQANAPRVDLTSKINTGNKYLDYGAKLAAGIPEGIINAPSDLQRGVGTTYGDIKSGRITRPQTLLSDVGSVGSPLLNLALLPAGGSALEQVGKQGIKDLAILGAKSGAKFGAGFGALGGLQSGRDINNPLDYAKNLGVNTAVGAGTGALLGGGLGALGGVGKSYGDYKVANAKNILHTLTPKEIKTNNLAPISDALQVLKNPNIHDGIMGSVNAVHDGKADASVHNTINKFVGDLLPQFNSASIEKKAQILDTLLSTANDNTHKPVNIPPELKSTYDFAFNLAGQEGRLGPRNYQGKVNPALPTEVKQGYKNAYKVFTGQKAYKEVAQLGQAVANKTGLPREIVVKKNFFDKMAQSHPEIDKKQLFNFVKTLQIPDQIYQVSKENRLNFFRNLEDKAVNLVSTGSDRSRANQNVITSLETHLGETSRGQNKSKYIQSIKNTSKKVFDINSGRADQIPSSDMLTQVPGAGVLPRSSESTSIIPQNVNNHLGAFLDGKIKDTNTGQVMTKVHPVTQAVDHGQQLIDEAKQAMREKVVTVKPMTQIKMEAKTRAGNPDPLPWEANGASYNAGNTPKPQQSASGELLPASAKSNPRIGNPQSIESLQNIINQKLKGGKFGFNEGLGSGVPKTPNEKPPLGTTPNATVKDAMSAKYVAGTQIEQRSAVLKGLQDQGIAPGEHNLYRDVVEHPEDLQKALGQVRNPQAFEKAVQAHREFTDFIYNANKASGGTVGYIKNYATHIYDLSNPAKAQEYQALLQGKAKNFKGYFNQPRVFNDLRSAAKSGFLPKNATAQEDIAHLSEAAQKEVSARVFTNHLKATFPDEVHVTANEGVPPANGIQLTIPGMKGTFVSPRLYRQISFLQPQEAGTAKKIADLVSGGLKQMELSGGLFHVLNTGMDYLGSHLAFGKMPRVDKAVHVFFSPKAMNEFRAGLIKSGQMDKMLKANVTLSTAQDFPTGEGMNSLRSTISKVNPLSMMNRATFTRLEDYFKASVFDILDKKGKIDFSTPEATRQTQTIGAQLNNIFGGQNRSVGDSVIKSKMGQFLSRQGILAPDYQEGRFKRTLNAVNPNITGKSIGVLRPRTSGDNVALQTLAGRLIATAVLAEVGRRVVTGKFNTDIASAIQNDIIDPSFPTPFKNKNSKGQDVGQVAHLPAGNPSDVLKLAKDPEHFAISHLGAGVSAGIGYVANQDYFGNKLSNTNNPLEKAKNIVQSKLPIPVVQAVKTAQGKENVGNALINVAGARVTQDPNDPIVKANKAVSDAYNTAYQGALSAGKSDLSAQLAGAKAASYQKVSNGANQISKDNKIQYASNGSVKTIDLNPPTAGSGIDAFTNKNWQYTKAREVFKSNIPTSEKQAAYKKLGVDPSTVEYDYKATHSTDVKTQYISSKATTMSHDKLLQDLVNGRVKSTSGVLFASDAVLTNLSNQGIISSAEAKSLKALTYDRSGTNVDSSAKPRKLKAVKAIKIPRIKAFKVKQVIPARAKSYSLTKVKPLSVAIPGVKKLRRIA